MFLRLFFGGGGGRELLGYFFFIFEKPIWNILFQNTSSSNKIHNSFFIHVCLYIFFLFEWPSIVCMSLCKTSNDQFRTPSRVPQGSHLGTFNHFTNTIFFVVSRCVSSFLPMTPTMKSDFPYNIVTRWLNW